MLIPILKRKCDSAVATYNKDCTLIERRQKTCYDANVVR